MSIIDVGRQNNSVHSAFVQAAIDVFSDLPPPFKQGKHVKIIMPSVPFLRKEENELSAN